MKKLVCLTSVYASAALLLGACTPTPPTDKVNYPGNTTPTVKPVVTPAVPPPAPSVNVTPNPPAASPVAADSNSERALVAAIAAYDRGEFGNAARQLNAMTNDGSLDPSQQLRALKTLAFSQCSSGAIPSCRQTFERAFRADPNFDLAVAERGHPTWGPQFERARKTVLGR